MPGFRPEIVRALADDGFAVVDGLVAEELPQLAEVRQRHPPTSAAYDVMSSARDFELADRVQVDRELKQILRPAVRRLAPDLDIIMAACLTKPARGGALAPHQDLTFTAEPEERSFTMWVPLQDVDASNGALRLGVGSHRWTSATRGSGPGSTRTIDLDDAAINLGSVTLNMAAGDAAIWDSATFHSSWPNRSALHRDAVAATIVRAGASLQYDHVDADGTVTRFAIDHHFLEQPAPFLVAPTDYPVVDRWPTPAAVGPP